MNSLKSWLPVLLWGGLCIALFFSTKEMIELGKENEGLKKENSSLIAGMADYEKRINSLRELDTKHTTELTNAKAEIDQLRIDVSNGTKRLRVKAECPAVTKNSTESGSDEATARLNKAVEQDYLRLREMIVENEQQTLYLQNYIKTECLR